MAGNAEAVTAARRLGHQPGLVVVVVRVVVVVAMAVIVAVVVVVVVRTLTGPLGGLSTARLPQVPAAA